MKFFLHLKKQRIDVVFAMLCLSLLSAFAQELVDYKLNVQNFSELVVVDGINVDYYCSEDSCGWAHFTTTPELASQIMFSNNKERLTIQTAADGEPIAGMPKVTVYSAKLTKIENTGDSTLHIYSLKDVDKLRVRQIDSGKTIVDSISCRELNASLAAGKGYVNLGGNAESAKFTNMSSGLLDADDLKVEKATCFLVGPGRIECNASKITVRGAGPGTVLYQGGNKLTNQSIGVKIVERNE